MQADRYRACDACSVDGLSVGAVVGGHIQPGRCGQGDSARTMRPGRCGQGDAAWAMRPGRFGQEGAARELRAGRCGQGDTARAARAGSFGGRAMRPGRYGRGGSSRLVRGCLCSFLTGQCSTSCYQFFVSHLHPEKHWVLSFSSLKSSWLIPQVILAQASSLNSSWLKPQVILAQALVRAQEPQPFGSSRKAKLV